MTYEIVICPRCDFYTYTPRPVAAQDLNSENRIKRSPLILQGHTITLVCYRGGLSCLEKGLPQDTNLSRQHIKIPL